MGTSRLYHLPQSTPTIIILYIHSNYSSMTYLRTFDGSDLRALIDTFGQDSLLEMLDLLGNPTPGAELKLRFYTRKVDTSYWSKLEFEIELLRSLEKSLESANIATQLEINYCTRGKLACGS